MAEDLLHALGGRIREARTASGLSQRELCARAGISPRFAVQLEAGRANVSVARLAEVAGALEVSLARLLGGLGPVDDAASRLAGAVASAPEGRRRALLALALPPTVALVGLRGAGKTTVGQRVAERVGRPFLALDARVAERAGMSLAEIFEYRGPQRYRELCVEALEELFAEPCSAILEVGGSVVLDPAAWKLLRAHSRVVWLAATADDHLRRVRAQGDTRPMAGREDALGELTAILDERAPLYGRADHRIDTSALGEDAAVEALAALCAGP